MGMLVGMLKIAAAQKHAVIFNSYNAAGVVVGKSSNEFTAQTENGIKFKTWFIGAGFGLDNYYKKTLPLFGAIKKEFPVKNNNLLLYANLGTNIIAGDKEVRNSFSKLSTTGGTYFDAGIGYKVKVSSKSGVYFTVGNSVKHIKETETSLDAGFPYYFTTRRRLSCISLRLGYQF